MNEKEIDKTIESICKWIQNRLKNNKRIDIQCDAIEMVKALAELISARAKVKEFHMKN